MNDKTKGFLKGFLSGCIFVILVITIIFIFRNCQQSNPETDINNQSAIEQIRIAEKTGLETIARLKLEIDGERKRNNESEKIIRALRKQNEEDTKIINRLSNSNLQEKQIAESLIISISSQENTFEAIRTATKNIETIAQQLDDNINN